MAKNDFILPIALIGGFLLLKPALAVGDTLSSPFETASAKADATRGLKVEEAIVKETGDLNRTTVREEFYTNVNRTIYEDIPRSLKAEYEKAKTKIENRPSTTNYLNPNLQVTPEPGLGASYEAEVARRAKKKSSAPKLSTGQIEQISKFKPVKTKPNAKPTGFIFERHGGKK